MQIQIAEKNLLWSFLVLIAIVVAWNVITAGVG
jgi:hypothetical protein